MEQGREIVSLARRTLELVVRDRRDPKPESPPDYLREKRGVFVTLNKERKGGEPPSLRGCIGFPFPVKELGQAVVEATIAASTEDPRFPPVEADELEAVLVEVSVLTTPETITVERQELPAAVRIGRDGLIVSTAFQSGLLLPQVAVGFHLSPEDFLSETCMKAGLTPDAWLSEDLKVQRFQAEIFSEVEPRGAVKQA